MNGIKTLNGLSLGDTIYNKIGDMYGRVTYIDALRFQVYTQKDRTERAYPWSDFLVKGYIRKV